MGADDVLCLDCGAVGGSIVTGIRDAEVEILNDEEMGSASNSTLL